MELILDIFINCKFYIACLLFIIVLSLIFIKDGNSLNNKVGKELCNKRFDKMITLGEICVLFDGITYYTVNHLDVVPVFWNNTVHLVFFLLYQLFIFDYFLYWMDITDTVDIPMMYKVIYQIPYRLCEVLTIAFIWKIKYIEGTYTNYSNGVSVYATFLSAFLYFVATFIFFVHKSAYIESKKKAGFYISFGVSALVMLIQLLIPEALVSPLAITLIILILYLEMENPSMRETKIYHDEMVMGFATLVENKDDSTGGHIRRSSEYAYIIAKQLRKNLYFRNMISRDFLEDIKKAAPMHDIGKIGIPDSVLQKPGKLTDEEFAIMKRHPEIGGKIIHETFGHLFDDKYENMAYQIAMYHHEKWNGKGYPKGLKGNDIPLAARIMAVADVFDAVSAKRCYRDALPLDVCFNIIKEGSGTDFDEAVVEAFFERKEQIEEIAKKGI